MLFVQVAYTLQDQQKGVMGGRAPAEGASMLCGWVQEGVGHDSFVEASYKVSRLNARLRLNGSRVSFGL